MTASPPGTLMYVGAWAVLAVAGVLFLLLVVGWAVMAMRGGDICFRLLVITPVGFLCLYVLRLSERMFHAAERPALEKESRPPVLFLRAFEDDSIALEEVSTPSGWGLFGFARSKQLFEEHLTAILSKMGPVVAIGRPGETVPPLGATRFWISDDSWQEAIDRLLVECFAVVMVMGELWNKKGLKWEADRLFKRVPAEKIILVMPPVSEEACRIRWADYHRLYSERIPAYEGGEVAIRFDATGSSTVIRRVRDRWPFGRESYDNALTRAFCGAGK